MACKYLSMISSVYSWCTNVGNDINVFLQGSNSSLSLECFTLFVNLSFGDIPPLLHFLERETVYLIIDPPRVSTVLPVRWMYVPRVN